MNAKQRIGVRKRIPGKHSLQENIRDFDCGFVAPGYPCLAVLIRGFLFCGDFAEPGGYGGEEENSGDGSNGWRMIEQGENIRVAGDDDGNGEQDTGKRFSGNQAGSKQQAAAV